MPPALVGLVLVVAAVVYLLSPSRRYISSMERENEALRFELKKMGVLKDYDDEDYAIIEDQARHLYVDPKLAWAVVRAENARKVATGGILSPVGGAIMRRLPAERWPHSKLVKGLFLYQIAFVARHPDWWEKHCSRHKSVSSVWLWREFFWVYRSRFVKELADGWLAGDNHDTRWQRNVLQFWAEGG